MWRLNQPNRRYSQSENANLQTSVARILVISGMNRSFSFLFHVDIQVFFRFFLLLCATCIIAFPLHWPWGGCGGEWRSPNVTVVILIDGVSGCMVPEHRASLHRHDKFQRTKCNGLINPCWGEMEIWWINSWWGWNTIGRGPRGVYYPLFDCTETRRRWRSGTSQLWLPNSVWRRSRRFWILTNDNVTTPSLHIIIINSSRFSRVIIAQIQDI